jgi:hypothetical protein
MMTRNKPNKQRTYQQTSLAIRPQDRRLDAATMLAGVLRRAFRYPVASLIGVGLAFVTHAVVSAWLNNSNIYGMFFAQMLVGVAEFLLLTAFMVFAEKRLTHLNRLFRLGCGLSMAAAAAAMIPVMIFLAIAPPGWESSLLFGDVVPWLTHTAHGLGVAGLAVVLPAFPLAWAICSNTGYRLRDCITLVWRQFDGISYSTAALAISVGIAEWLLLSLPGFGLIAPVFFAHAGAFLFAELVIVEPRETS